MRMRKCPICRENVSLEHPHLVYSESLGLFCFEHFCDMTTDELDVVISVYGKTEEEVIRKWNGVQYVKKHTSD